MLLCCVSGPGIITLTTDFGTSDAYVGVMKGVILGIAPDSTIVDISHQVLPQNVSEAAYLLRTARSYFPPNTVHVCVVDPGVGTERRAIAIEAHHGRYVGPDNGVFVPLLSDQGIADRDTGELSGGIAVQLTNDAYWRHPVSRTFHGRDIFAPVAAHLAIGTELGKLGVPIRVLEPLPEDRPTVDHGQVRGRIVHVDHFGNAISNIEASLLPDAPTIQVANMTIVGLSEHYQEAPLVALVGSAGLLEIAARNRSAARTLGLAPGDEIVVRARP